jgi:hypothetical protein
VTKISRGKREHLIALLDIAARTSWATTRLWSWRMADRRGSYAGFNKMIAAEEHRIAMALLGVSP